MEIIAAEVFYPPKNEQEEFIKYMLEDPTIKRIPNTDILVSYPREIRLHGENVNLDFYYKELVNLVDGRIMAKFL